MTIQRNLLLFFFIFASLIRGNRDNLGIISNILHKYTFCDPSLGANEGSQHMFSLRNKKNYL